MTNENKLIHRYMQDIGNLRSHHWKYWCDIYQNCAYDCKYCVYRNGEKMGKILPLFTDLDLLSKELDAIGNGIVYLGPKADVYQQCEKNYGITRKVLELFYERNVHTFIVTRSTLIRRDYDIIKKMAEKGLIEISISIASSQNQQQLEPNTPDVDVRLELVNEMRMNGIPVSVHLSPIIPFLDTREEISDLMKSITTAGASCIYACMLGMSDRYYSVVKKSLASDGHRSQIDQVYLNSNKSLDVYSADQLYIKDFMTYLYSFSRSNAVPFACVHIPELDVVERTGHIFRQKLPNVGDIIRHFNRMGADNITLNEVLDFARAFPACDEHYIEALRHYWNTQKIFKNTYFHAEASTGNLRYVRKNSLDLDISNMKVGS